MLADPFSAPLPPLAPGFVGSPLDRADEIRRNAAALWSARMDPGARWLVLEELKPVVRVADGRFDLRWARRAETPQGGTEIFLGLENGAPRFAVAGQAADLDDGEAHDARGVAAQLTGGAASIVAQARSLLDWHARHRFCAACGAPTTPAKAGYARHCSACATEHFPRTDPVVIMLSIDVASRRCLLGRQPRFPKRFMSALAGFVEPGESLEEAVARELWEEAGVRTGRVRYIASQPWPFPCSLMIGAFAEATSTEIRLDTDELEEARWFSRDEVRAALAGGGPFMVPPPLAIAHTLLKAWTELD